MMAFFLMLLAAIGVSSVGGPADEALADDGGGDYVPGELLVEFKDTGQDDEKKAAKDAVKGKGIKTFKNIGVQHWKLDGMTVEKALKELGNGDARYTVYHLNGRN